MSAIEQLQDRLAARGIKVSDDQAVAMALRISGTVDAYLDMLTANDAADDAAGMAPASGEAVSDKLSDVLTPILETDAESGIPD